MNFLADESVDFPIVKSLRDNNYNVDYVAELKPGITDDQVMDLADQRNYILITADKDFGDLTFRKNRILNGIILCRLSGITNNIKADILLSLIKNHHGDLFGSFTVLTKDNIRIKKLPERS